ncbi:hypothetical protein Rs2_50095 [Raphanus sativus]|nr:hypothetical protein Rs2_50267 [Raphanus sativus]KAJ4868354.1 hypothetical protein Rs2_50095 [Raphanus sativus]
MRRSGRRTGKEQSSAEGRSAGEGSGMRTTRRCEGKEHCVEDETAEQRPDEKLPPRFFATDRYPSKQLLIGYDSRHACKAGGYKEEVRGVARGWWEPIEVLSR